MLFILQAAWNAAVFVFQLLLLLFLLWSFWHGSKIESNGITIELYGIKRFFVK